MEEFVDAYWARNAVATLDRAIQQWNLEHPSQEHFYVVWGPNERQAYESEGESNELAPFDQPDNQFGLIGFRDSQFEVEIESMGDDELPLCRLRIDIGDLSAVDARSRMEQLVEVDVVYFETEPAESPSQVVVTGLGSAFFVDGLSGRGLAAYCQWLQLAKQGLELILSGALSDDETASDDDTATED